MPYLLIIIDEFAELITNHPEFLELFVGIGRVGRSLGMHLLLATQRLEEGRLKGLETYLRYRICLRTFSAAESNIALGTPDAFYLPSAPGVGYFKVDTDKYSLFKTALISTPYVSATEQKTLIALVREFTATGKLITPKVAHSTMHRPGASSAPARATDEMDGTDRTEMQVVIECMAAAHKSSNSPRVHQVSLPPLPEILKLDTVLKSCQRSNLDGSQWQASPAFGPLRIPIGLLDKPLEQAQEPLLLDFSGGGGHLALVGAPQAGKSTLLHTMVASFIVTHSPRDVQIYAIDLGGGLLRAFEGTPHVGTICTNSRVEGDKIRRLVRHMRKIIEERAFLFQEQRIDITTYRLRRQAGEFANIPFGDVFFIIDNLAQLYHDFDQLKEEIIDIVAIGLNYGVHVILAANRWAEIPPKLRENIGTRLELRLNDSVESEFGKAAASTVPAIAGRGLTKDKLHFQTALPWVGESNTPTSADTSLQEVIASLVQRAQKAWKGTSAPPVRMLPAIVKWQQLPQPGKNQLPGVPIGVDEFRIEPVYIDLMNIGPHFLIFGDAECGKTNLLRVWMRGLEQRYTPEEVQFAIVDYRRKLVDLTTSKHLVEYAHTPAKLKVCVEGLKGVLDTRQQQNGQVPLDQLDDQKKWSGPRYFLFVDDYDALVQGANPLTPLFEHLLQARDTGWHLILARTASGAASTFDTVLKRLKELGSPGVIMNGNPQEGPLLGTQRASPFPPGRGYLVRRKYPPTQIQVALAESPTAARTNKT